MKKYTFLIISAVLLVGIGIFSIHTAQASKASDHATRNETAAKSRQATSFSARHPQDARLAQSTSRFVAEKAREILNVERVIRHLQSEDARNTKIASIQALSIHQNGTKKTIQSSSGLISQLQALKENIQSTTTIDQLENYETALADIIAPAQQ